MAAPKKNDYWKIAYERGNFGRPKHFDTPEKLVNVFNDYLEVMKTKTWKKQEFIKSGERAGDIIELETQTPLTMQGFCLFAGVNTKYFYDFEKTLESLEDRQLAKDFSEITTHIRETITEQKLQGAMVGAYNPMIVARIEGLKDKQDITSGGESISLNVNVSNKGLLSDLDKE